MQTLKVDRYLSESDELKTMIAGLGAGERLALIAPTGAGKTTLFTDGHVQTTRRVVVAVPTIGIGMAKQTPDVPFFCDGRRGAETHPVSLCTYDNLLLQTLDEDTLVVIDEAHRFAADRYRAQTLGRVMNAVEESGCAVVLMSATLASEVWRQVWPDLREVRVETAQRRDVRVVLRPYAAVNMRGHPVKTETARMATIADVLKEASGPVLCFAQNKAELQAIADAHDRLRPIVVTAEEGEAAVHNDERARRLLEKGDWGDSRLVLATSYMWEGVDLRHDERVTVVVALTRGDRSSMLPANLMQMASRLRDQQQIDIVLIHNVNGAQWLKTGAGAFNPSKAKKKALGAAKAIHARRWAFNDNRPYLKAVLAFGETGEPMPRPSSWLSLTMLQESYNKGVLTGGWRRECRRYNLEVVTIGDAPLVKAVSLHGGVIWPEVEREIMDGDIYSHMGRGGDTRIARLVKGEAPGTEAVMRFARACGDAKIEAYPTIEAASRLWYTCDNFQAFLREYDDEGERSKHIVETHQRIAMLQSPEGKMLEPLRRAIWRRWGGKRFRPKEFSNWLKTLKRVPGLALDDRIKRSVSVETLAALFTLKRTKPRDKKVYIELIDEWPEPLNAKRLKNYRIRIWRSRQQELRGPHAKRDFETIEKIIEEIEESYRDHVKRWWERHDDGEAA